MSIINLGILNKISDFFTKGTSLDVLTEPVNLGPSATFISNAFTTSGNFNVYYATGTVSVWKCFILLDDHDGTHTKEVECDVKRVDGSPAPYKAVPKENIPQGSHKIKIVSTSSGSYNIHYIKLFNNPSAQGNDLINTINKLTSDNEKALKIVQNAENRLSTLITYKKETYPAGYQGLIAILGLPYCWEILGERDGYFNSIHRNKKGNMVTAGSHGTPRLKKWDKDGNLLWADTRATSDQACFIDDAENMYFGGTANILYKFDPDGNEILNIDLGSRIIDIEVFDENIYVGGYFGVKKYNSDGVLQWSYTGVTDDDFRALAIEDNALFVGTGTNKLKRLDQENADINTEPSEDWEISTIGSVRSKITINSNNLYIGSSNGALIANKITGDTVKSYSILGIRCSIFQHPDQIILGTNDGHLIKLDSEKIHYNFKTLYPGQLRRLTADNDNVFIVTSYDFFKYKSEMQIKGFINVD